MKKLMLVCLGALALAGIARAEDAAPGPATVSLDAFRGARPPFSFTYNGQDSAQFLGNWKRSEEAGEGVRRFVWSDPAGKLKVTAEVRTFADFPALEWVLYLEDTGTADTAMIDGIKPLHWSDLLPGAQPTLHYAKGTRGDVLDFKPMNERVNGGYGISSSDGSSLDCLPFFDLQSGTYGVVGAIGWSGNWSADFMPNEARTATTATAGMPKTHLVLHPGERIRSPRIVLLPWQGDWMDAQNQWRRLVLAHYSPRHRDGTLVKVPICWGSWGADTMAERQPVFDALKKLNAGIEVYWVDAGWYGDIKRDWSANVGNWTPSPVAFPDGIGALGKRANAAGMKLLLWMASEEGMSDSPLYKEHPDWFYRTLSWGKLGLLRFSDPKVLKAITDITCEKMEAAGASWFRQDAGVNFNDAWYGDDKPDRVGMNEIEYVTNFYAYWDALRARIPGLEIDNCCSGGKRLDIETMSRSVCLWRTDAMTQSFDISMEAMNTQGLAPWVPLNGGVWTFGPRTVPNSARELYHQRSTYSAGLDMGGPLPADWLKGAIAEYKEVQPYFYGDFYPLLEYSSSPDAWSMWQLDRPDLKSGVVMLLRRPESPLMSAKLPLHGIDAAGQYDVEVRLGAEKTAPKKMSGADLLSLVVSIPDEPGSALVFYKKI